MKSAGDPDQYGIVIDPRYCGPPRSGNGGYVSGKFAAFVDSRDGLASDGVAPEGAVEVTLRSPPPLGVRLSVAMADGELQLRSPQTLVAQARTSAITAAPPSAVAFDEALAAAERYAGRRNHPFPTCFVCGLDRAADDGMRLQPGAVSDSTVAAAWQPHESLVIGDSTLGPEFAWAALDCPGGWAAGLEGRPMVLGRMTARVLAAPETGRRYAIVGELRGLDGRKAFTATALYADDGELLAHAEATWLTVDPSSVRPQ
ncbi:MAG: PaaI family thioesterase [Acidothermaceae bacterium]